MNKTMTFIIVGLIMGGLALLLSYNGNPPNMGVCVACFLRDSAGALKLQNAPPVQYMRPEILSFAIGAFISALAFKSFRPTAGSAPVLRFTLGFFMMVGCLVFLGCPLRVFLRIGGGDLNAVVGLVGLVVGILIGVIFLKKDFALPANQPQKVVGGLIFPIICIVLLMLVIFSPQIFSKSTAGPGSMHAPVILSIIAGLVIGLLIERTRFCSIGFISHMILFKRFGMLLGVVALIAIVTVGNIYLGKYKFGFEMQPIAHTDGLWNFLSMVLVGTCGVFLSGCPLRQIVKAGTADGDAVMTVIGMIFGAAIAHNFAMASAAQSATSLGGPTFAGKLMVILGIGLTLIVGIMYSNALMKRKLITH